ncbi:protein-tyrosine phosphatase-like protein [Dendryphion nanum]|uniref:protein-tyrosine-phosphatase n=1 Tax=Dendryphion nanum TaxID=256645 RepID=A0A9P9DL11_9PLEO|nr:protein-tyrosine phosphatase-like protein [Dendryphion nanum]
MSFLLHGSSAYSGMGWLDSIPGAPSLYIGGLYAVYQTALLTSANMTHVLSVIDYDTQIPEKFPHLQHLHIRIDDDPNEDLLKWFDQTSVFIEEGLQGKGGVFVHCAMGKSRSATMVVAYLMWKGEKDGKTVTWEQGLAQLCEGRPVCDPNPGFKEQLEVYGRMLAAGSQDESHTIYEQWEKERFRGSPWEWEKRAMERQADKARL